MDYTQIRSALKNCEKLILFQEIKTNNLILNLKESLNNENNSEQILTDLIYQLIDLSIREGLQGDIWHNYLKKIITASENIFSLKAEKGEITEDSSLYRLAANDLKIINKLFAFSFSDLASAAGLKEFVHLSDFKLADSELDLEKEGLFQPLFASSNHEDNLEALLDFYYQQGASILNESRAFYWQNNKLSRVNNPDSITFANLISYQNTQKKLIENTESFLNGFQAHNVLLYGDSGTGKSSSVKALVNKFYQQGLRLIEIRSSQIKELPAILEYLNERGLHFIIFMDDLSFEEFETEYKYLKAVMEGGIESRPDNVLFYATSNRRHLVREKWQDRESEVHENDILNEKLSLSERFGLTLMFSNPSQADYLKIVRKLAAQADLKLKNSELEKRALQWSRWNNGRSGRTARQFIDQLKKEMHWQK
ncbi:ATP-binding protein [Halanaerobium saccharolyticum]|uniref:ATP-binding protein n=1 Tax=Halanaerobium saccharolyticum TaxID=43595 RepID=UPI003FCE7EF8